MTVRPYEEAHRPVEPKTAKKAPAKKKEETADMSVTTLS